MIDPIPSNCWFFCQFLTIYLYFNIEILLLNQYVQEHWTNLKLKLKYWRSRVLYTHTTATHQYPTYPHILHYDKDKTILFLLLRFVDFSVYIKCQIHVHVRERVTCNVSKFLYFFFWKDDNAALVIQRIMSRPDAKCSLTYIPCVLVNYFFRENKQCKGEKHKDKCNKCINKCINTTLDITLILYTKIYSIKLRY